jgi:hypothetical protein
LIRDRVAGLRRRKGGDDIGLVLEDQLLRDLGGTVGVRLAVLDQDLIRMGGTADRDIAAERPLELVQYKGICSVKKASAPVCGMTSPILIVFVAATAGLARSGACSSAKPAAPLSSSRRPIVEGCSFLM